MITSMITQCILDSPTPGQLPAHLDHRLQAVGD